MTLRPLTNTQRLGYSGSVKADAYVPFDEMSVVLRDDSKAGKQAPTRHFIALP